MSTHDKIRGVAADAGYPYDAVTNKATLLIRLGETSPLLPMGQALIVIGEDGSFGLVYTLLNGQNLSGSVDVNNYDRA